MFQQKLHGKLMSKWRVDLTKAFETELLQQKLLFNKLGTKCILAFCII